MRIGFCIRRCLLIAFYIACAAIVAEAALAIVGVVFFASAGFDSRDEFVDLPGTTAKKRLRNAWPPSVDASEVYRVSHQGESSRDSYSSWYRVELSAAAASAWIDYVHERQDSGAKQFAMDGDRQVESVHRVIPGPPPMRQQTGATPAWWSPPPSVCRATEVMLWYSGYDSGVGRATYSVFDRQRNTIWVYDYACQHDKLWHRGNPPSSDPVLSTAR